MHCRVLKIHGPHNESTVRCFCIDGHVSDERSESPDLPTTIVMAAIMRLWALSALSFWSKEDFIRHDLLGDIFGL